jgi:hypothetical protein
MFSSAEPMPSVVLLATSSSTIGTTRVPRWAEGLRMTIASIVRAVPRAACR